RLVRGALRTARAAHRDRGNRDHRRAASQGRRPRLISQAAWCRVFGISVIARLRRNNRNTENPAPILRFLRSVAAEHVLARLLRLVAAEAARTIAGADHAFRLAVAGETLEAPAAGARVLLRVPVHHADHLALAFGN